MVRGSVLNTSSPAPSMVPCSSASSRAASSMMAPRETLIRKADGLMAAISAGPIRCWVSGLRTQWTETKSHSVSLPPAQPFFLYWH